MDFLFSTPHESVVLFLFLIAIVAGFVDAIAGGGGLITVPGLLLSGVPPITALGTNRMQSAIGELTSVITYWRHNVINVQTLWLGGLATAIGAIAGSFSVSLFSSDLLRSILPIMMVLITLYSIFSNRLRSSIRSRALLSTQSFLIGGGLLIGFYNGFFGPGVGSIWMLAFIALLGLTVKEASISTKPLNLIGNVVSMCFFAYLGAVDYALGLAMGVGQIIGAFAGSRLVIANGDKVVRPCFIAVCLVMTGKLIYENLNTSGLLVKLASIF